MVSICAVVFPHVAHDGGKYDSICSFTKTITELCGSAFFSIGISSERKNAVVSMYAYLCENNWGEEDSSGNTSHIYKTCVDVIAVGDGHPMVTSLNRHLVFATS